MTERYNVQASTILGENYNITNIECSDYNPSIDESITVTITLTDVYTDPISDEDVTVTCTGGSFTQLNGTDIPSDDSVTGTTNSSGQFTLTYACSEWGLITFSANNNKITQVRVKGWKRIWVNNSTNPQLLLYRNEDRARLVANGWVYTSTTSWSTYPSTIASSVRPAAQVWASNGDNQVMYHITGSGDFEWKSNTGATITNKSHYAQFDWAIRDEDL